MFSYRDGYILVGLLLGNLSQAEHTFDLYCVRTKIEIQHQKLFQSSRKPIRSGELMIICASLDSLVFKAAQ